MPDGAGSRVTWQAARLALLALMLVAIEVHPKVRFHVMQHWRGEFAKLEYSLGSYAVVAAQLFKDLQKRGWMKHCSRRREEARHLALLPLAEPLSGPRLCEPQQRQV